MTTHHHSHAQRMTRLFCSLRQTVQRQRAVSAQSASVCAEFLPRVSFTNKRWAAAALSALRSVCYAIALITASTATGFAQTVPAPTTRYEYDALGNLTKVTDGLNHATSLQYDALNRVIRQTQPPTAAGAAAPVIQTRYNGQDQLTGVTDPRNLVTSYTVNAFGEVLTQTSPDTGTTTRTYDAAGNLLTSLDANNQLTTYSYDALQRLTRVHYQSGTDTVFEYDGGTTGAPNAKGRLTKLTDESGQTTFSYDPFGRLTSKVQTIGSGTGALVFPLTITYGSSAVGSPATSIGKAVSMTYPSGNRITTTYDAVGRVASLSLNPTVSASTGIAGSSTAIPNTASTIPLILNLAYQPFGLPVSWTWGNSTATAVNTYARAIDQNGRVSAYPLGNALYSGINRTLTFDAASRITASSHELPEFNQRYTYDDLDRITQFNANALTQSFTYDPNGNRTNTTVNGSPYSQTISPTSNRLTANTGPTLPKTNTYLPSGQLASDGVINYAYNAAGRIKQVTMTQVPAPNTVAYRYNGFGQRVNKTGPSTLIPSGGQTLVFDAQGHIVGEYDATGKVIQETIYLDDLPIAVLKQSTTGTAPSQSTATSIHYVYADHLNTPKVIIRATDNNIVWHWANADAFGLIQPDENPFNLGQFNYNPRFPGQIYDKETNNHYNYFRDYDPAIGRYIESDPIGLGGGINTYGYVENNPLSKIDPTGQYAIAIRVVTFAVNLAVEGLALNELKKQVAQDRADEDNYHRICDQREPPGLDKCESAKFRLNRAQQCYAARDAYTKKHYNGVFDAGHAAQMQQLQNAIKNAERDVERYCKKECP